MTLASPLQWPANKPRTRYRKPARFQVTLAQARDDLYDELERMGAAKVTISSNARLNLNGTPAAKQPYIPDPGVAVYYTRKGVEQCIACDRWDTIGDNIRAIGLSVAAIRGIERWGTTEMVDAAFSGFAGLPETTSGRGWVDIMGLGDSLVSSEVIEARYRELAKTYHPDAGGDPELWLGIQTAYEQATASRRT